MIFGIKKKMDNFDTMAIATNIPQRLKTGFGPGSHIGISHKKMLYENANMRINSNNVHKKHALN